MDQIEIAREKLGKKIQRNLIIEQGVGISKTRWMIFDPVFTYIQRGNGQGRKDYRSGILIEKFEDNVFVVGITTMFSPIFAKSWKSRLDETIIFDAVRKLEKFGHLPYVKWDSKRSARKGKRWGLQVGPGTRKSIIAELTQLGFSTSNWIDDWFVPNPKSSGQGKDQTIRGNHVLIATEVKESEIVDAVMSFADLFLRMYPDTPIASGRKDNLRRELLRAFKEHDKAPVCSFRGCSEKRLSHLEADHIKPFAKGGHGHRTNGTWLCIKHHHQVRYNSRGEKMRLFDQKKLLTKTLRG